MGDSNPDSLVIANGTLFFSANDGLHGDEPWVLSGLAMARAAPQLPTAARSELGTAAAPKDLAEPLPQRHGEFEALGLPVAAAEGRPASPLHHRPGSASRTMLWPGWDLDWLDAL